MELKHLVQRFVYRIEPNPAGGFIARSTDPTVPPLEAPTREELQQKIQARLAQALGEVFPGLKVPLQDKRLSFNVHIDHKPGGGFSVHSDESGAPTIDPATQEKIDHYAEEVLGFVDKHFPHLSETLAAQINSKALEVFTTQSVRVAPAGNSSLGTSPSFPSGQPSTGNVGNFADAQLEATTIEKTLLNSAALSNAPIVPESSGSGKIFRFLLTLLILAALLYFFVYRR